jgi:hypothetical protein
MNLMRLLSIAALLFSVAEANDHHRKVTTQRNEVGGTNVFIQGSDKGVIEFKSLNQKGKPLQKGVNP